MRASAAPRTHLAPLARPFARRRVAPARRSGALRVECRNRILFREREVDRAPDGEIVARLPPTDPRAVHSREILGVFPGDPLRVGVVNDAPATAVVESCPSPDAPDAPLALRWRPGEERDDPDTARRSLSSRWTDTTATWIPPMRVDLLLAVPRPKVLRRMWAPLASMGVDRVYLTNAARVERYYFDSKALEPDAVEDELLRGLEQSGDVYMPGVCVARRFPAAFDALGVTGEAPREGSAEWLVDPPPERTEPWSSFVGCSEPTPVLLMAHPGSRTSLREALGGAGRAGWGYGARRVVVAVGPEGGWTEHERERMLEHGFREVALGNRTFASDVACVSLVAAVRERTESW